MNRRSWLAASVAAGIGLNTVRLRHRLSALPVIEPSEKPVLDTHVFLVAAGVELDEAGRRAASAHAQTHGLDVLDLVPDRLAPDRLLDLARQVDASRYEANRLATGRGAYQALLVDRTVLARAGLGPSDVLDTDLAEITVTMKRYAPVTTAIAVLPGLRAAPRTGAQRFALQRAAWPWEPVALVTPVLRDLLLASGARVAPGWTLAAAALSWLQPAAIAAGGPIRPRTSELLAAPLTRRQGVAELLADLALQRAGAALARWRISMPSRYAGASEAELDAARAGYRADLAHGVERFLGPRRTTCPWCGGGRLGQLTVGVDTLQVKPGRFRYDRCLDCRHVFQNPRLSPEGLEFYYRDFYGGLGRESMERVFGFGPGAYPARARAVPAEPRDWLDVGAGHGHFCLVARDVWPTTSFDGLDLGDGLREAANRGWVENAFLGFFPDLAPSLAGRYDVVSMFHYLEHTPDPRAELDAARLALRPGGRLLIEVPNPESVTFRVYGPLSSGMLIPQHLNLLPAGNLVDALTERGFVIEQVEYGQVHISGDAPMAWYGLWQLLGPPSGLPWRDERHPTLARARRAAAFAMLAPLLPLAVGAEVATRPFLTRGERANAYRILARLPDRAGLVAQQPNRRYSA
jgi:SAM-dependent methyltransferase